MNSTDRRVIAQLPPPPGSPAADNPKREFLGSVRFLTDP